MTLNGQYRPAHTARKAASAGATTGLAALAAIAAASPVPLSELSAGDTWPAALVSILAAAARAYLNWRKQRPRRRGRGRVYQRD